MTIPVFQITTPNGTTYNVQRASAVNQKKVMMIVGAVLTKLTVSPGINADNIMQPEVVMGAVMALPEDKFDALGALLLEKVFISGTDRVVTLGDFQGDMMGYFHLLSEAVRENLSDFFIWLSQNARPAPPPAPGTPPVQP